MVRVFILFFFANSYNLSQQINIGFASKLKKNTDILTNDYKTFAVVAMKDIKKHEELTVDYNLLYKHYPFITPSKPDYKRC